MFVFVFLVDDVVVVIVVVVVVFVVAVVVAVVVADMCQVGVRTDEELLAFLNPDLYRYVFPGYSEPWSARLWRFLRTVCSDDNMFLCPLPLVTIGCFSLHIFSFESSVLPLNEACMPICFPGSGV